jgi:hypothetical protein
VLALLADIGVLGMAQLQSANAALQTMPDGEHEEPGATRNECDLRQCRRSHSFLVLSR